MQTITSIKDERIVLARTLQTRQGRHEHQRMLLEGEQIIDWAIDHGIEVETILATNDVQAGDLWEYQSHDVGLLRVSPGIQKKVTGRSYVVPLVGVGRIPPAITSSNPDFVVVLDNVQDFGNIGTIIRTCHAFGIRQVLSTKHEFDLYHRKTITASRGTVFSTAVELHPDGLTCLQRLRERGYQVVATSPRGDQLQSLVELEKKPVALIVGNESCGVDPAMEDQADVVIQIPMAQTVESLNVGVAAGISIYELRLKQVLSMIEKQIKATLGRELNVAGMLVQKALDSELRKVSALSSRQVIFMMVLKCDEEMSIAAMCRQFGVLDDEVGDFLDPLVQDGLILQGNKLTLTTKGESVLAKLWFTIENTERRILSEFTHVEADELRGKLRRIQEACVEVLAESGAAQD